MQLKMKSRLDAICSKLKSIPQSTTSTGETTSESSIPQNKLSHRRGRRKSLKPRSIFQRDNENEEFGPVSGPGSPTNVSNSSADAQDSDTECYGSAYSPDHNILDEIGSNSEPHCNDVTSDENADDAPMDLSHKGKAVETSGEGESAMDLTVPKTKIDSISYHPASSMHDTSALKFTSVICTLPSTSASSENLLQFCDSDTKNILDKPKVNNSAPATGEASVMKDYAEDTMKELLSIYGLNDVAETIANNVPLSNFATGKILERHASTSVTTGLQKLYQKNIALMTTAGVGAGATAVTTTTVTMPSITAPHGRDCSTLRTKVVGSLTHVTATPDYNGCIEGPHVIVHRNMVAKQNRQSPIRATSPRMGHTSPLGEDYIKGVFPLNPAKKYPSVGRTTMKDLKMDVTKYMEKYFSAAECKYPLCLELNYREHFHCLDCQNKIFMKKEEMVRHYKWHKKRDESLQHGFLRYSPMDDCSDKFDNCAHNGKQTHYHCMQTNCDKVYISTSDVQMHANYHRKDSAIMQEGFQRYRATEDCGSQKCQFYQQRTTHFHCRRTGCNFTFKNKADMEKHKSYHIKDEQLNKDGFKKFMKHEHCSYENCRFSKVCNHIHCIRPGCLYVLHSTGQLYSHKRKHERRDSENAYKKFKEVSFSTTPNGETTRTTTTTMFNQKISSLKVGTDTSKNVTSLPSHLILPKTLPNVPEIMNFSTILGNLPSSIQTPTSNIKQEFELPITNTATTSSTNTDIKTELPDDIKTEKPTELTCQQALSEMLHRKKSREDEEWKNYLIRYTANDPCMPDCEYLYKDHYHCMASECGTVFKSKDGIRWHARCHGQQNFVTETQYYTYEANQQCEVVNDGQACPYSGKEKHYHCKWPTCKAAILTGGNPFQRLDHYKLHVNVPSYPTEERFYPVNSDGAFIGYIGRRKRGRPPKNRIMSSALPSAVQRPLVPVIPQLPAQPFLTTTAENSTPDRKTTATTEGSEKTLVPPVTLVKREGSKSYSVFNSDSDETGFNKYRTDEQCPDDRCPFANKAHYHCKQPNCHHVLDREDLLVLHSKDFHDNIEILDGFAFFDRSVDCRLPSCNSNKVNRHFHCVRPGCNYSFVRYSTMAVHEQRHKNGQLDTDKPPHKKLKLTVHDPTTFQKRTTVMLSNPVSQPDAFLNPSSYTGEKSTVKAAGTFFPLSTLSSTTQQASPESSDDQMSPTEQERKLFYPSETCGRPFCKLRKRDHFHCHVCNQAFSSVDRLRPHLARHEVEQPNNTRLAAALQASSPEQARSVRPILPKSDSNQHINEPEKDSSSHKQDNDKSSPSVSPATSSQPSVSSGFQLGAFPTSLMSMGIGMPQPGAPFMFHPQFLASALATSSSYNSEHSAKMETTSATSNENSGTTSSSATPATLFSPPPGQFIGVLSPGLIPFTLPVPFGMAPGLPLSQATALSQPSTPPTMSTSVMANLGNILPPLDEDTSNNNNNNSEENRRSASLSSDDESEEYTRKQSLTSESDSVSSYTSQNVIQQKKSSPPPTRSSTANKDDFMPEGYVRYRYSEDCQYTRCSYRNQLTHFHCIRDDCGYSFCDRARIVQHTARHERLDTLMANEFQQFRQNMNCKRENCEHITKASHFHCLKCDFTCTDTSKVVAHRRQHAKMDSIAAAGFEKYNAIADCQHEECNYKMKQTHYHCLKCSYSVVGLSSMESHKFKHL